MSGALIVTYHGIEPGPAPLFVEPALFEAHLDALEDAGATVMTVSGLVAALRARRLPERAVALTFDDGFQSVHREAMPRLAARGMPATVYCVAGHLGGRNDWRTQPPGVPLRPLALASEVAEMAASGIEIGSHATTHEPLGTLPDAALHDEVVGSRQTLEDVTGTAVTSFACPYGDPPSGAVRALVERTYASSCGTAVGRATTRADPFALPRVDAHYLRRPELLRRAAAGHADWYLGLRGAGARVRRLVVRDFAPQDAAAA